MWKKDEENSPATGTPAPTGGASPPPTPRRASSVAAGQATIGRSITIRGDVTGDEDLVIQGRIEGTVDLEKHNVTVGPEGRVKADIAGRMVTVEGEVEGDIRGQEQVALRASSRVNGDIVAPRVVLEDGASFLGSIDMSGKKAATPAPTSQGPDKPAASPTPGKPTASPTPGKPDTNEAPDTGKTDRGAATA